MRTPVSEYATHQATCIPTVTLSSSPGHSQSDCPVEQGSVLCLYGNESPLLSPKHSPKQNGKSKESLKFDVNAKEYSQITSEKLDSDQQDTISRSSDSIHAGEGTLRSIGHERSSKERKESRASDRTKKRAWYNALFSTYKSRSEEFKRYFKHVPPDERLVVDYSCALQRDILIQGRLYITQNYLCFYANIFGWETCVIIKWKDVSSVTKEKTALVIPNAILVSTDTEKLFFTTFATRDKAYVMLFRVWQNALMDQPLTTQELWSWIHTAYGEELGLTSDDEEDYNYIPPGTSLEDKLSPSDKVTSVRLSSNSLVEQGCPAISLEKGGSEVGPNATDSTNKSHGTLNAQQAFLTDHSSRIPEVIAIPTDMSDNSSESDAEANVDRKPTACTSPHDGRLIVSTILPIHIDLLFQLLFTNSKFLVEFHTLRRTTDFKTSSWQKNRDSNEKIRTITMVVALTQPLGPRSSNVHETQILQPCSKDGQLYSIDGEVVNSGIPYSDSFYVVKHYCLEKAGENETQFNVYAQLKYKKNVWAFMKNMIEKNTWGGLEEFYDALVKALQAECDGTIVKGRIIRRRRRAIASKPTHLPVDQISTSGRGSTTAEGEQRNHVLLLSVLVVLVVLVFLNGLLYYKLWVLEEWEKSSKSNLWQTSLDMLKDPPKTHGDWFQVLRHQENLHQLELDNWRQTLQLGIQFLHKAEESLNELRNFIKSYSENVMDVMEKNEKEEL